MIVFRIEREKSYLKTTLAWLLEPQRTEGVSRGQFLIPEWHITAETRALATLEVSVHLDLSGGFYQTIGFMCRLRFHGTKTYYPKVKLEDLPEAGTPKPPVLVHFKQSETTLLNFTTRSAVLRVPK